MHLERPSPRGSRAPIARAAGVSRNPSRGEHEKIFKGFPRAVPAATVVRQHVHAYVECNITWLGIAHRRITRRTCVLVVVWLVSSPASLRSHLVPLFAPTYFTLESKLSRVSSAVGAGRHCSRYCLVACLPPYDGDYSGMQ